MLCAMTTNLCWCDIFTCAIVSRSRLLVIVVIVFCNLIVKSIFPSFFSLSLLTKERRKRCALLFLEMISPCKPTVLHFNKCCNIETMWKKYMNSSASACQTTSNSCLLHGWWLSCRRSFSSFEFAPDDDDAISFANAIQNVHCNNTKCERNVAEKKTNLTETMKQHKLKITQPECEMNEKKKTWRKTFEMDSFIWNDDVKQN